MGKLARAILFAIAGAVVLGALVFGGGFVIAQILGGEAAQTLGMLVPMLATPLAIVAGAALGFMRGWKSG